jgi:hypothetical protein
VSFFVGRLAFVVCACIGRFGVYGCCDGVALAIEVAVGEARFEITNRWNATPRDVRFWEGAGVSA